jgi:excisionase family DNA binding protein
MSAPTPLYVRLPAEETRRLERAVAATGKTKRQLVGEAVREHLGEDGLTVGRVTPLEPPTEVLTLPEAAHLLRLEDAAVRAAADAGELPGRRVGEEWRFSRSALLDWLGAPQGA